ncbi:MAG: hypothetical protein P8106_06720 [Gammaproteobacteria bacterium]
MNMATDMPFMRSTSKMHLGHLLRGHVFQGHDAHPGALGQRHLGIAQLRRHHAGGGVGERHHPVDRAIDQDGRVVHAQQQFQGRQQVVARDRGAGLHGDRALHARVHHVGRTQHVAQDHLDHLEQVGVLEIELDFAAAFGDLGNACRGAGDQASGARSVEAATARCARRGRLLARPRGHRLGGGRLLVGCRAVLDTELSRPRRRALVDIALAAAGGQGCAQRRQQAQAKGPGGRW